jgi:putative ABC transport system permease protein
MFTEFEYQEGTRFQVRPGGRFFDPSEKEAVLGSYVAEKVGLQTGSKFSPYHGLIYDEEQRHESEYTVVGVLETTNTPSDRVVWIPIEGIFRMPGHVLRGTGQIYRPEDDQTIPDEHKEVSAVMLKFVSPQAGFMLDQSINRQGKVATLAWPIGRVMAELFDKIGWVNRILELVAYLVIAVAAGSILASIYNTINERRREFAILRALGARRLTVFSVILMETATIASLGAIAGYAIYIAILSTALVVVRAQTGVVLDPFKPNLVLLLAPAGMLLVGAIAGILPALKAYSTDVASNLTPTT